MKSALASSSSTASPAVGSGTPQSVFVGAEAESSTDQVCLAHAVEYSEVRVAVSFMSPDWEMTPNPSPSRPKMHATPSLTWSLRSSPSKTATADPVRGSWRTDLREAVSVHVLPDGGVCGPESDQPPERAIHRQFSRSFPVASSSPQRRRPIREPG